MIIYVSLCQMTSAHISLGLGAQSEGLFPTNGNPRARLWRSRRPPRLWTTPGGTFLWLFWDLPFFFWICSLLNTKAGCLTKSYVLVCPGDDLPLRSLFGATVTKKLEASRTELHQLPAGIPWPVTIAESSGSSIPVAGRFLGLLVRYSRHHALHIHLIAACFTSGYTVACRNQKSDEAW